MFVKLMILGAIIFVGAPLIIPQLMAYLGGIAGPAGALFGLVIGFAIVAWLVMQSVA